MSEFDRIRWHCRRGLLELDLVLASFLERHLHELDPAGVKQFEALLEEQDNDLLDVVMGRAEPADPRTLPVAEMLRRI